MSYKSELRETVAYMQLVPGSFKSYPCDCGAKMGNKHKANCPVFYTDFSAEPVVNGEQCGRCWQNHTPGFVCSCDCHTKPSWGTTTTPQFDNGDDLDAPQTT